MRWHDQLTTREGDARLPGLADTGVVTRTFDAPEALATRFHEINAKSVLNRVPGASQLPFGWTVNPYRGCSHACSYCVAGDTRVRLADGTRRRMDRLRPGDLVAGTAVDGGGRRVVTATVLDHWEVVRAAYRVTLADGTAFVCSGDHRVLTARGWRHVTPGVCADGARAHLAAGDRLLGLAGAAGIGAIPAGTGPAATAVPKTDGPPPDAARVGRAWRGRWTDGGARVRLAPGDRRATVLAGRLAAGDRARAGLSFTVAAGPTASHAVPGGPTVGADGGRRVASVEPVGERTLYDVTTTTGDYVAAGVVHHNCFARPTHEYLGLDAGRDFEREIVVKVNAPEVLRAQLRRPSWTGEHVALGTNTDPYQWVERRYGLTRALLEVLRDARNPCSVLTKSPLLLRDLELMRELVELVGFSACLSIPTLDERAWRATEPHTPHPRKRIEAVAKLNAAGIPTGVLVAPLMPGINDSPAQVQAVVAACDAAGATRIGGQALFLRGSTRDVFLGWLRQQRPDLVDRYEALYGGGRARLGPRDRRAIEAPLSHAVAARGRPHARTSLRGGGARSAFGAPARPSAEPDGTGRAEPPSPGPRARRALPSRPGPPQVAEVQTALF